MFFFDVFVLLFNFSMNPSFLLLSSPVVHVVSGGGRGGRTRRPPPKDQETGGLRAETPGHLVGPASPPPVGRSRAGGGGGAAGRADRHSERAAGRETGAQQSAGSGGSIVRNEVSIISSLSLISVHHFRKKKLATCYWRLPGLLRTNHEFVAGCLPKDFIPLIGLNPRLYRFELENCTGVFLQIVGT